MTDPDPTARELAEQAYRAYAQYESTGNSDALNTAIELYRQAVAATPAGSPARPGLWNNLAIALRTRFETTGDAADLDEAIELYRQAIAATPAGNLNQPGYQSSLASAFLSRFEQTGDVADLDEAITLPRQAAAATLADSPARAGRWGLATGTPRMNR